MLLINIDFQEFADQLGSFCISRGCISLETAKSRRKKCKQGMGSTRGGFPGRGSLGWNLSQSMIKLRKTFLNFRQN